MADDFYFYSHVSVGILQRYSQLRHFCAFQLLVSSTLNYSASLFVYCVFLLVCTFCITFVVMVVADLIWLLVSRSLIFILSPTLNSLFCFLPPPSSLTRLYPRYQSTYSYRCSQFTSLNSSSLSSPELAFILRRLPNSNPLPDSVIRSSCDRPTSINRHRPIPRIQHTLGSTTFHHTYKGTSTQSRELHLPLLKRERSRRTRTKYTNLQQLKPENLL